MHYIQARLRAIELFPGATAQMRKRWARARADVDQRYPAPKVEIGKYGEAMRPHRMIHRRRWLDFLPAITAVGACLIYAVAVLVIAWVVR